MNMNAKTITFCPYKSGKPIKCTGKMIMCHWCKYNSKVNEGVEQKC